MKKRGSYKLRTTEGFIKKAINLHGNLYDYSLAEYISGVTKTKIICKKHGIFKLAPSQHLHIRKNLPLRGCPKCSIEKRVAARTKTKEQFIIDAQKIHGKIYDYSLVNYKSSSKQVIIICRKHGQFKQKPVNHLEENGCNDCGRERTIESRRMDKEDYIRKVSLIHKNKYNYSNINTISSLKNIPIICPIHGLFEQNVHVHLRGSGCSKCSSNVSHMSQKWLDLHKIPDDKEHREVRLKLKDGSFIKVDGFKKETNTIYEFYGDFFHGNPNVKRFKPNDVNPINKTKYKDLYIKTKNKEQKIKSNGYNLTVIWEKDWLEEVRK